MKRDSAGKLVAWKTEIYSDFDLNGVCSSLPIMADISNAISNRWVRSVGRRSRAQRRGWTLMSVVVSEIVNSKREAWPGAEIYLIGTISKESSIL